MPSPSVSCPSASCARRGLSAEFLADLHGGLLAPLRERVVRHRSLCLELSIETYADDIYVSSQRW